MRALRVLLVLCASARVASAGGLADEARANVRDVLARPEFRPLADADLLPQLPRIDVSWAQAIVEWIWEVFGGLIRSFGNGLGALLKKILTALMNLFRGLTGTGGASAAGTWGTVVTWAVVAAAIALLVWLFLRLYGAARVERRAGALALAVADAGAGEDDALARTPEDWRRRAERLAASGDRVEALRALYLELLAGLHRLGAIDYDRTRTNTAYVFDLARAHPARAPFLALTGRFDRAVYGAHDPTEADLRTAMSEVDEVRGAFSRGAAHA